MGEIVEDVYKALENESTQTNPHLCGLFHQDGDNLGRNAVPLYYVKPISPHQSHPLGQGSRPFRVSGSSTGRSLVGPEDTNNIKDKSGCIGMRITKGSGIRHQVQGCHRGPRHGRHSSIGPRYDSTSSNGATSNYSVSSGSLS